MASINIKSNQVGIDRIIIYGFIADDKTFNLPYYGSAEDNKAENVKNPTLATIHPNKVVVKRAWFTFNYGIKNNRSFAYFEFKASEINIHYGLSKSNLKNLCIKEIYQALEDAEQNLKDTLGIKLEYDINKLRVRKMEINKTIITKHPFENYERIFRLISYGVLQTHKKAASTGKTGFYFSEKGVQTIYILDGKTIKVKAYNKTQELKDKNKSSIDDIERCRVEITADEQNLSYISKNSTDNKCYFTSLTDSNIKAYYYNYFIKPFYIVEKEIILRKNIYEEADLISKNFKKSSFSLQLLGIALKEELRRDPLNFLQNLLIDFYYKEKETGIPVLVDLSNLILDEEKMKDVFPPGVVRNLNESIDKMYQNIELYNPICKNFINQASLFDEILAHLTQKKKNH